MNPKHTSLNLPREKGGKQFYARAPYNFVPLPEQVVTVGEPPDHDHYEGNTGYIECELETKSPLYVRGIMTQTSFEDISKKSFHELTPQQQQERAKFFILRDNEPVIPGSSLRGMIRTLVEIVGFGKVQPVGRMQRFFYRAVAASKDDPLGIMYRKQIGNARAGYLVKRKDEWYVRPARKIENESFIKAKEQFIREVRFVRLSDSHYKPQYVPVSFSVKKTPKGRIVADQVGNPKQHPFDGIMVCTGNMMESGNGQRSPRKNHCIVPEPDTTAELIPINRDAVSDYVNALSDFEKEEPFDKNLGCLVEGRPVFYLTHEGEIAQFGHTPNFRLPFVRKEALRSSSAQDFVPEPLRRESDIDLAEAMFGYIKSDAVPYGKARAYASRVFVSDAVLETGQTNVWFEHQEMLTPKILSSPKPTTFQHYLVQGDDAAREMKNLKHYASDTPAETVIRGHKLYWHKPEDMSRADIEIEEKNREATKTQQTGIKPVRAGVKFNFRVYFENLNDAELGALLWVLGLPDGYCQSLGMGKPLGMGAVKITPTLYLSDRRLRYTRLFKDGKWADGVRQEISRERFTRAFENFMLDKMDVADKGNATTFREVERIQMLLKMLEYPGPERDWTRYMTIEPENEFKERPVLPDPLHIVPTSDGKAKPTPKPSVSPQGRATKPPASQQGRSPKTPTSSAEKKQAAPPQSLQSAASASPYKVGDTFNGTVNNIWSDGTFIIQTPKMTVQQGYARVSKADAAGKNWQKGGNASCEVVSISADEKGRIVLVCKASAKKGKK